MDIQLEKLELMKLLLETNNPTVLEAIRNIFQKEEKDWYEELPNYVKEGIEEGQKDITEGNCYSFDEVLKILREE